MRLIVRMKATYVLVTTASVFLVSQSYVQDDQSRKKTRANFTPEEDQKIIEGINKFGTKSWLSIVECFELDRTPEAVSESGFS